VSGLKAPNGVPHDLGQFYFLIDPTTFSGDVFWDRLARVSDAVTEQEGTRLPGMGKTVPERVEIDSNVWAQVLDLAG
jgi:(2R)-3-sulfolactate dehydrogenase (NADP+)